MPGVRYVDVGCRSLGLGATLDHFNVASVLRALREEEDPVVVLLENHCGDRGDLYELRIPDAHREQAEAVPWRAGRLTAAPAIHELGLPAAHLYAALSAAGQADVESLVEQAHLSRATVVYRATAALAEHGLVTRTGTRWRRSRLSLDRLARRLAIAGRVAALLERIRSERLQWRALLGLATGLTGPEPRRPGRTRGPPATPRTAA